jgi:hypothetical protein
VNAPSALRRRTHLMNIDHRWERVSARTRMTDDQPKKDRSRAREVFDFLWQSALGAIVGVGALLLLLKYT